MAWIAGESVSKGWTNSLEMLLRKVELQAKYYHTYLREKRPIDIVDRHNRWLRSLIIHSIGFGAIVRLLLTLSPVLATPFGSSSITPTSSSAFGQCSTPFGTTNTSPGFNITSRSRSWMFSVPESTRNISSVSGCECHTNSPRSFASFDLVVIQGANCALGPVVGEFGKEMLQVEGAGGHVEVGRVGWFKGTDIGNLYGVKLRVEDDSQHRRDGPPSFQTSLDHNAL